MKTKIKKLLHNWLIPIIILLIYFTFTILGYFGETKGVPFYYLFIPLSIPVATVLVLLIDIE